MQEGESELGGLKIPHGNTNPPTPTPGPQPDSSATSVSEPVPSVTPNSELHAPLAPQSIPTVSPVNPIPSQPPQPMTPPSIQASPQPFQQFQSQQFQSPQLLQHSSPSSFPPRPNPVPASPFANTASPNPFSSTPTAVFPNTGDVVLSGSEQKKSNLKKWLIVIISVLAVGAAIFGVITLISNIAAGPVQQVTAEQYYELNADFSTLSQTYEIIEDGLNGNLSIYDLLLADYFYNDIPPLYNAIYNRTYWEPKSYNVSDIIEGTPKHADNLENTINAMYGINYPSEIKKKVKELYDSSSNYTSVISSFANNLSVLRTAFIKNNSDAMDEIISDNTTLFNISLNTTDYIDVISAWDACAANMGSDLCADPIAQGKIENIINDKSTVSSIFAALLSDDDINLIQSTNSNLKKLLNSIVEKQNAK